MGKNLQTRAKSGTTDFKLEIKILKWYDFMQTVRDPIMYIHTKCTSK